MNKSVRYATSQLTEDQYEPGSKGRVLKNLLGITTHFVPTVGEEVILRYDEKAREVVGLTID